MSDWGFGEFADELQELANAFSNVQERKGTSIDASGAIEQGVENALDNQIVPEAQSEAENYVPVEDARSITHGNGVWVGDEYRHSFFATSDLVKYHEFGTGGRASNSSKGSVDGTDFMGRPGYIITPNGDWPLGIPASRWNGPGSMVDNDTNKVHLNYVVHPGVEGQHFMKNALENNEQELRGFILSQINRLFRENDLL